MPTKQELKERVCREIDAHRGDLLAIADTILRHPETGFKEFQTAKLVAGEFAKLGLAYREDLAITGLKAVVKGGSPGPTVAVLGELDALVNFEHPFAHPQTGAAHACGHNGQIAAMLGVAVGLLGARVMSALAGNLVLFAVPAEELIEVEYRMALRRQGKLEFLTGKAELIRLGEFDDVDVAMMVHATCRPEDKKAGIRETSNGALVKLIQYTGRPSHAGGAPHQGINALNAATLALSAIHAQRETFRDDDSVRVHPIITKGGEAVNVVPADVRMETFVRGKTLEAIQDANLKVDRALKAGALAVGAKVRVQTLAGYLPQAANPRLVELFKGNMVPLIGAVHWAQGGHGAGSTDMGDLMHIMPAIHPYAGGATGTSHGRDFAIADPELTIINPAKAMAITVIDLLADGAALARGILATTKPRFTKAEYLDYMRRTASEFEYAGE